MMPTADDIKIAQLHQKVKELINNDFSEDEITAALEQDGIEAGYSRLIIENVLGDKRDRADFWKLIFMGSFFTIGGLLLNYYSYKISEISSSSFFILYWGIVVFGIVQIFRAFILYKKSF